MDWWTWICWGVAGALALAGGWLLYRALLHDRSRGRRRCRKCWYDMSGAPGLRCPECGREFKHERQLLRTRRRWGVASAAALVLALAGGAALTPRVQRDGWLGVVPTPALLVILSFYEEEGDAVWKRVQGRIWNPNSAAGLTTWEKLLVARYCGQKLLEDVDPTLSMPVGAAAVSVSGKWEYLTALQALGKEARPAVPGLAHAAATGDLFLRQQAVEVLGAIGEPARPALPALLEIVEGSAKNAALAAAAAGAIGRILADGKDTGELRRLLRHEARWMRFAAMSGLADIGPGASAACPAIVEAAKADAWLAAPAAHALVAIADGAPEALADLLSAEAPALRREAARGLGQLGAKAAPSVPALAGALADPDAGVRRQAAAALGRIGPAAAGAIDAMGERLPVEPDALVRLELVMAFRKITPEGQRPEGRGASSPLASLAAALSDPDRTIRNAAARELEAFGPAAAPARAALERTAADEAELGFIREAAADALRAIAAGAGSGGREGG